MTSNKRFAQSAVIKQDLVVYDGPQLVLLESDRGHRMLAVGVSYKKFEYAMFATEVPEKLLRDYFFGRVDLQFTFYASKFKAKYFFDYASQHENLVPLNRALEVEIENTKFYPEHGIFSRLHTNPLKENKTPSQAVRFYIDGSWESEDFLDFTAKLLVFIRQHT